MTVKELQDKCVREIIEGFDKLSAVSAKIGDCVIRKWSSITPETSEEMGDKPQEDVFNEEDRAYCLGLFDWCQEDPERFVKIMHNMISLEKIGAKVNRIQRTLDKNKNTQE